ncbi:ABC transporter substrate-binding protein [Candidatus Uabimicrobium amorphum]|uniref:Heme-binding protein n=1 Tax=Uabimicrobium amorphum TaxID=2596890 RepID=A0A5S9IK86_UABAM|nr:ABC transporter substrate-binding protein [Candidatus Uabimicrobium amorphum]BBM83398.1 heme-binding protein [Candidatus Uabimicrobium amorphum]
MRLITFVGIVLSIFLTVSCGERKTAKGKVYWHSEDGAPTKLDPIESATTYANRITTAVYDTLYEYKYLKRHPYELKPNLAANMPEISEDGLVYTIKIKEGVKFIDDACFKTKENPKGKGREVVAADFVYSLKRHFDPKNSSQGSWLWRGRIVGLDDWGKAAREAGTTDYAAKIKGLQATDKYTIQITLTEPYPQILYTFAMGFASVVPQEAVEKYGKQLTTNPVGSGPFMLKSFNKTKAVLVKNPTYRKEVFDIHYEGYDEEKHGFTGIKALHGKTLPIVDTVIISFMKQDVARWNSLNKGNEIQFGTIPKDQIDNALMSKKPPKVIEKLAKKFHFDYERESGFVFSVFNMTDPAFGYSDDPKRNEMNKALRKAIRKAFDWQGRIDVFYAGIGEPFVGIIPPGISGYSEFPKDSITRDVEGAKKLLKDAGWTAENLPVFEYPNAASTTATQFFEQVRGWLEEIGYPRKKIKQKEFATFGDLNKSMKERKNIINSYGWGLDYPDAENVMQLFYGPNASPGSNASNFDHPEYNELFEKAKPMPDSEERTKLYKRMTEILLEECVGMFGFSRTRLKLWNKNTIMYPTREILSNVFKYVDVIKKDKKKKKNTKADGNGNAGDANNSGDAGQKNTENKE